MCSLTIGRRDITSISLSSHYIECSVIIQTSMYKILITLNKLYTLKLKNAIVTDNV